MAKREFQRTDQFSAYRTCKDGASKIRYPAVRLYGWGYPVTEIQHITHCSRTSLREWVRAYQRHGVRGLVDKRAGGNSAKLNRLQLEDLHVRWHQYTPRQVLGERAATPGGQFWTVVDLYQTIQQWYGVAHRSRTSL